MDLDINHPYHSHKEMTIILHLLFDQLLSIPLLVVRDITLTLGTSLYVLLPV